ncbi:hypothetical protein [Streptomyces colonosanans]|uniref:hypothetical protein n=1 Tax=Streptomyces colonosanans TaxID=1428652 RepID=UPI0015A59095|nr:hypothetical protein [Streptomyces colonosanans]
MGIVERPARDEMDWLVGLKRSGVLEVHTGPEHVLGRRTTPREDVAEGLLAADAGR